MQPVTSNASEVCLSHRNQRYRCLNCTGPLFILIYTHAQNKINRKSAGNSKERNEMRNEGCCFDRQIPVLKHRKSTEIGKQMVQIIVKVGAQSFDRDVCIRLIFETSSFAPICGSPRAPFELYLQPAAGGIAAAAAARMRCPSCPLPRLPLPSGNS